MKGRVTGATGILTLMDQGLDLSTVFWNDETWVHCDLGGDLNRQKDRMHLCAKKRKIDHLPASEKPKKQRAPGLIIHIAVTLRGGRPRMLPACFVPEGTVVAKDYYVNILASAILPNIYTTTQGSPFASQQDLASPHTCAARRDFFESEKVELLTWFGPGDDVSPLDVFDNNALKDVIREKDISNIVRLKQEAAAALQRMSDCPKFLD